jgi:MFS family permease
MRILTSLTRLIKNFFTPGTDSGISPKNYRNVQIDALGVGMASSASPFLPIFLARLGGSSFEISLLNSMPAVTGALIALPLGRFLQKQDNIVKWFSLARVVVFMGYALTGLITFFVPSTHLVTSILLIWALLTIPQTLVSIAFTVVMSKVAGPIGRYDLMSRRWSILGLTTAVTVYSIGQVLDLKFINFPYNYTLVFIALSLGGWISFYFSRQLEITNTSSILEGDKRKGLRQNFQQIFTLIRSNPSFTSFVLKRTVYTIGGGLTLPLFPIYFVRVLHVSDSWIAGITTAQTLILFIGYFIWTRQKRLHGSRVILLVSTFGLSLYPILTGMTQNTWLIAIFAGTTGIFSAGLNLVFFDELLQTVPSEYSATFVSVSALFDYFAVIISPIVGSFLGDHIGIGYALMISGGVRMLGVILFALSKKQTTK